MWLSNHLAVILRSTVGAIVLLLVVSLGVSGQPAPDDPGTASSPSTQGAAADSTAITDPVELLQPVGAPAADILGLSLTTIPRAATATALKTLLYSALSQSGGHLPQNFAVEFAPYWLFDRPALTFDDYYRANTWQNAVQTLTLSVATAPLGDGTGTKLGIGVRSLPVTGRPNPTLIESRERLSRLQVEYLDALDRCEESSGQESGSQPCTSAPEVQDLERQVKQAADALRALDHERIGWHLEIDAALRADFPDGSVDASRPARAGVWVIPTYRSAIWTSPSAGSAPPPHYLDFAGIVRYLWDDTGPEATALVDMGASVLWTHDRFAVQGEVVRRGGSDAHASTRLSGLLQYEISDDIYLIGVLGNDFKDPNTQKSPLIAHLGLQFHFGDKPVIKLP